MTSRKASAGNTGYDPYELDRLAEELEAREVEHRPPAQRSSESLSLDLPSLEPLSHNNRHLVSAEFNVEEFLLSRSYTSLPDLRSELREYLATLKEELVKLINDDYEAFISLSTSLKGEGARLDRMKSPLIELRSQMMASRNQLQSIQDAVKDKLERRAILRDEKVLLQLLLGISDSISRLESLLLITASREGNSSSNSLEFGRKHMNGEQGDDRFAGFTEDTPINSNHRETATRSRQNRAKHLLRIATEYNQLLYHSEKALAENCVFVTEMQWRIERIKSTLSSDLEYHFTMTLLALVSTEMTQVDKAKQSESERTKLMTDLNDCLRAYDLLSLWRDAEDVIRREIVREFVKKTIHPGSLSGPHSPVLPHTPFPRSTFHEVSHSSIPPRTPYTPFTAFAYKTSSFFPEVAEFGASIYLLDDSDNPLATLYNKVLRFIARDLKAIMETAEQLGRPQGQAISLYGATGPIVDGGMAPGLTNSEESGSEFGFNILANAIWVEVSRAIAEDLGVVVFSAGKPEEFRKNYETTQAFLRSLEYLAPSLEAVRKMRCHPSFETFEKRWQLPVYFQMRWKEIVGRVEEVLEVASISTSLVGPAKSTNDATFVLSQSAAVWHAVSQCWAGNIFLPNLGHRFWRLTLQLLNRYRGWIESNLPLLEPSEKAREHNLDKVVESRIALSRTSTPVPQDIQGVDRGADDDRLISQCSILMRDIKEMDRRVIEVWKEEISVLLQFTSPEGEEVDEPEGVLRLSLASLTSLLSPLSSQIEMILIRRCCDSLTPVKSLPGQFRATSHKHLPSKPSAFVPLILRPVKLFFGIDTGEGQGKALKGDFCVPMSTNIVDAVATRYISHVSGMRKTEESLRRLRMGKKTGFSLFGNSSSSNDEDSRDEERIRTQLVLDIEAFGKDAELLGVDTSCSTPFSSLNHMVHSGVLDVETQ